MALPIRPTPTLSGDEALDFLRRVEEGLKKPLTSIPTPKLGLVKGLVEKHLKRNEGVK